MELPKIDYSGETVSASKIAYDLALIYAKAKLDKAFHDEFDFDRSPVNREVEEIEYLRDHFLYALAYLSGSEPGEDERSLKAFRDGEFPRNVGLPVVPFTANSNHSAVFDLLANRLKLM